MDGVDRAVLDFLQRLNLHADGVDGRLERVLDSHQRGGVVAHCAFQLAPDFVGGDEEAALLLEESFPAGTGFWETFEGVLLPLPLELTAQPLEFLRELEDPGDLHTGIFYSKFGPRVVCDGAAPFSGGQAWNIAPSHTLT